MADPKYPVCVLCNHEITPDAGSMPPSNARVFRHFDKLDCIIWILLDIRDQKLGGTLTFSSAAPPLLGPAEVQKMLESMAGKPPREHIPGCEQKIWSQCGQTTASCGCWCHEGETK